MLIQSIHFSDYRLFRNADLPLDGLTVLIGPNGSGKSTALGAIEAMAQWRQIPTRTILPIGRIADQTFRPGLDVTWSDGVISQMPLGMPQAEAPKRNDLLATGRVFSLDPSAIATVVVSSHTSREGVQITPLPTNGISALSLSKELGRRDAQILYRQRIVIANR